MDRRLFLAGVVTAAAGVNFRVFAQTPKLTNDVEIISAMPPLPSDLVDQASLPPAPYVETALVGTAPPSTEEIDKAYELLVNAPIGGAPIDIAQYFLAVGAGAYGEQYRPFAREWPVRANPLIFHFFSSTQTKPEGDVTPWCAAFVNWCLLRAHASTPDEIGQAPGFYVQKGKPFPAASLKRYSTNNASSGSFRCWDEVVSPKRGDIVVLKDPGSDDFTKVCRGNGHVTFFVKIPSEGRVQVLGGNQSQAGSNGAVTVANISTLPSSKFMKYVSPKA